MCSVYNVSEKEKLEALYYSDRHSGNRLKYWICSDSGSTINVCKDRELFDENVFEETKPIGVQTTGGTYTRINKIGVVDILPKVYYDPDCFINIWCDYVIMT